jgi:hypothetical protein
MQRNPFDKVKFTRRYKTNTEEWKKYSTAKKRRFLATSENDQLQNVAELQSDCRVGTNRETVYVSCLVAGGATSTVGDFQFEFNNCPRSLLLPTNDSSEMKLSAMLCCAFNHTFVLTLLVFEKISSVLIQILHA